MGFFILLLFIAVPITEIAVFIQVGDLIGLWPTLLVVILTALLGTYLLRQQGLQTLARAQMNVQEGKIPAQEIFDGLCLLLAGALLLTPGFVTDTLGFILFFPPFRLLVGGKLIHLLKNSKNVHVHGFGGFSDHASGSSPHADYNTPPRDPRVIDADFEEVAPNPDSPWSDKGTKG